MMARVQAKLPETSIFFSAGMGLVNTFFQMFIVLGMYNFVFDLNLVRIYYITKKIIIDE